MDPDRPRRVEEILHGALEHEGPARAAYLDGACPNAETRREVEALIAQSDDASWPASGTTLGPYRIEGPIGAGGMGTVYKALDTRLHRPVAIKISAARFSDRFEREARAIAALNHPYVCTLYDIGPNYLVMEYVEGVSLRQLLRERAVPIEETLQYAAQIAAAMEAAHAAGIIHRDLKPGNVMVTRTGLIKVLDFGLAKVMQPVQLLGEAESTATVAMDSGPTRIGAIMGSTSYMSPEQALGKQLDSRSDIFAFGALLYEMLTRRQAFRGDSTVEVLSGIIHVELPPPSAFSPAVPPPLDALVARCLRKDPAQRLQSMIEVQRELKAMIGGTSSAVSTAAKPNPAPARRSWRPAAAFAAALALAAIGVLLWRMLRPISNDAGGAPEISRVTTDAGLSIDPAISADGKLIAYASDRSGEGNLDIWVQQIGGGDPIRLTNNPADDSEPDFSPDGTHVVFRSERDGGGIYTVATTGGEERKLAGDGRRPRFSPDGTKVLYWTGPADPFPMRNGFGKIFVLDLSTSTTRQIRPDFTAAAHPVWSPDGKKILFVGAKETTARGFDWWITPANGGAAIPCPVMPEGVLFDPFTWRGNRVYFVWYDASELKFIGQLTVDAATGRTGKPFRYSATTSDAYSPSVSKNGIVAFAASNTTLDLYSLPLDANTGKSGGTLGRLTNGPEKNLVESISDDGTRVAFTRWGIDPQVWGRDFSTGHEVALTEGGAPKANAIISPDGRLVSWREAFASRRNVFITPFEGGAARQICSECSIVRAWSPDGKFILYDRSSPRISVGLLEVDSAKTRTYLQSPEMDLRARSLSRDGNWMAFTAGHSAAEFAVYVAPFAPERAPPETEWVKVIASPDVDADPQWSPDGGMLYFSSARDGYNCLWGLRLNPKTKQPEGALFPVRHFHSPSLVLKSPSAGHPKISLARDQIVLSLQQRSGGIWMMRPSPH
jgi:eukaryotic-like serine/threonine-protein kinase